MYEHLFSQRVSSRNLLSPPVALLRAIILEKGHVKDTFGANRYVGPFTVNFFKQSSVRLVTADREQTSPPYIKTQQL
jgi:hypothetical protein